jgi:hypothetical protein
MSTPIQALGYLIDGLDNPDIYEKEIAILYKALEPEQRFTLTDPSDPQHPGILDSHNPHLVAAWDEAIVDGEARAREYLNGSDEAILYNLAWEERVS